MSSALTLAFKQNIIIIEAIRDFSYFYMHKTYCFFIMKKIVIIFILLQSFVIDILLSIICKEKKKFLNFPPDFFLGGEGKVDVPSIRGGKLGVLGFANVWLETN